MSDEDTPTERGGEGKLDLRLDEAAGTGSGWTCHGATSAAGAWRTATGSTASAEGATRPSGVPGGGPWRS